MRKLAILFGTLALLLQACSKESSAGPRDLGYDYFPVTVGKWVEYQVDSVWRDDYFNIHDSVSYRLLERIEEAYTDPAGRPAWRIHRYVRDEQDQWVVRDVWTCTRDNFYAERTEENVRLLKLSFPINEGRRWDYNVYNPGNEWEMALREVHKPYSLNGLSFDSTLIVRQTVPANFVARRDLEERYAKHVGMVRKSQVETTSQFVNVPGQPPQLRLVGTWWTMEAVDHGSN